MQNSQILEGNLFSGGSVAQASDDHGEEGEKETIERDSADRDPPVPAGIVEERVGSQTRSKPRVGRYEMKGMLSSLGKAWELPEGGTTAQDHSGNRDVVTDYIGIVEAGPSSTIQEAMESKQKEEWRLAIAEEMANLEHLKTWMLVKQVPEARKPITSQLVLQKKLNSDVKLAQYKARLVAHGFKQQPGGDFHQQKYTFDPYTS